MGTEHATILTVNAGSSSVKLSVFTDDLELLCEASVSNIGQANSTLTLHQQPGKKLTQPVLANDQQQALDAILAQITDHQPLQHIRAIGHRIVHGGPLFESPTVITPEVITQLQQIVSFDPEHMQAALELIQIVGRHFPGIPQVACFDTTFYREMPREARRLPLPRKLESSGLRRYGFHGLSYEYLLRRFGELAGQTAAYGRIVFAHLGSGASLTAVKNHTPLDTTMSFTPASGIPMSTRAGDLDPGIAGFLHRQTGMTFQEFDHMIHFESGLLGVSGLSADMELLISESAHNPHAAEAVDLFCYQVRKAIGSLSAVLGGVDSLIFSGGMGENAPLIREKICEGLEYLGITVDRQRNQDHDFLISRDDSPAGVHVIHTDEAMTIAIHTQRITNNHKKGNA